ncbi:S-adenosyl-L-methionine-dependent methyltransferase [Pyrenochaeta sp. MPI-SDFR-AT-0127]|nr:S-adenosyl-L-methionine-dependent methyltransferase [Pyrenochaeta sp. MPI-SDFR-AT-0127]
MKGSFLSLNGHVCAELEQHIADHSSPCSSTMTKQWLWSSSHRPDADKMCSMAQLSWLKNTAMDRKAKRGCYTGLSAMAWFEGTATTNAEILTIEADSALAAVAQQAFTASGYDARITIKQGWAAEVLPTLTGTFDVVFVDIAFDAYQDTVRAVLDLQLLAPDGIILVDNGLTKAIFARGFVSDVDALANIEPSTVGHWRKAGALMRDFNAFVKNEARVTVSIVPIFDGVSEIRWKHT